VHNQNNQQPTNTTQQQVESHVSSPKKIERKTNEQCNAQRKGRERFTYSLLDSIRISKRKKKKKKKNT
jgi:hypothetical protein